MKTLASVAVAGIAMASAVILSNPGRAAPPDPGLGTITAAAFDGTVVRVADDRRGGSIELSAQRHRKGGNHHSAQSHHGGHRSHHGNGGNGAAIAAGVLGVIGGLIAADQARRAEEEDGYYDEPPPRHWRHRCRYGVWIDEQGYEHCRR